MTTCGASDLRRGLTLIELLAAMAIFLGLAGMVLQILGGGLDLWTKGERSRDSMERSAVLLDRLADELRHGVVADGGDGEPRIKMYCDFLVRDVDGDMVSEATTQRLLFVRRLFEEQTQRFLREAGRQGVAEAVHFVGRPPAQGEALLPTEGLVEVAWIALPDYRKGYEGRLVLWRALRSPIGGPGSLFRTVEDPAGSMDGVEMEALAENLLHLGFEFLTSDSVEVATEQGEMGPLMTWDSTRGILEPGEAGQLFRYAAGRKSRIDPDDDIFPRAVEVTVIVAPPPDEMVAPVLSSELPNSNRGDRAEVVNGRALQKLGSSVFVKIGHEWMEASAGDARFLEIRRRGVFGTVTAAHKSGVPILFGRMFSRVIQLPAYRESLNRKASR